MDPKKVDVSSVERLDKAITVVGIKGWAFLVCSLLLFIPVILWSFLGTIPIAVSGKCLFFDGGTSDKLEIYGFVPFFAGQSIVPGMRVECALDVSDIGRSGMLVGVVKEVLPYPADLTEPHVAQIPSTSLQKYLLQETDSVPLALVIAEPLVDKTDPSKFVWTYNQAPMVQIRSGTTGTIDITLSRVKPISYIIPSKGKK